MTSAKDGKPPSRGGSTGAKARGPKLGRPMGRFTQHRRLDRLKTALEANPAGLSIAEIATVLHVTPRSVRRYLGYLKLLTPIEAVTASPGRENVWRIKPSERARAVPLRRAAAYCLLAGRPVFEPMKGSALFDALDVVHRQVQQVANRPSKGEPTQGEIRGDTRLEDRFVYVAHPAAIYSGRGEEIDDLFRAAADLHVVHFRYGSAAASSAQFERIVAHPYAVFLHRGGLSLVAFDVGGAQIRSFSFEKMADLSVRPDERFALPADMRASEYVHGAFGVATESTKVRVLVEFDARVADEIRARKLHPTQKIATAPDGRVRLSVALPATLLGDVRRWVLSFADAAHVIEPLELVADIGRALSAAAKRYA